DGNVWFTEIAGNRIGRITPGAPNTITEFPLAPPSGPGAAPDAAIPGIFRRRPGSAGDGGLP
ncbi:MAG: hypothetical protein ACRDYV_11235, partial [Acidimicrobiia bacterium]